MSEKILSPSVLLREQDISTLPQTVENSSFVVISPAEKGKYFVPKSVSSRYQFEELYGKNLKDNYLGVTVNNFLNESFDSPATVMSVANIDSYNENFFYKVTLENDEATPDSEVVAIIGNTSSSIVTQGDPNADPVVAPDGDDLELSVAEDHNNFTIDGKTYSLDQTDNNFIGNFTNPRSKTSPFYVLYMKDYTLMPEFNGEGVALSVTISKITPAVEMDSYKNGESPWVVDSDNNNLFKIHALQDGDLSNRSLKIEIDTERYQGETEYPSFDLYVRSYDDQPSDKKIKEQHFNLNLDPESSDYIGVRIGNANETFNTTKQALVEEGLYTNRSPYIRVELLEDEDYKVNQTPNGFQKYDSPFSDFSFNDEIYDGIGDEKGINFDHFTADYLHSRMPSSTTPSTEYVNLGVDEYKFVMGLYKGTTGQSLTVEKNMGKDITTSNCLGFDFTDTDANGYKSYKRALDILDDTDRFDFSLLVLPAINCNEHESIVNEAISFCERRGDVFLVLDAAGQDATEQEAITGASKYDTSYSASFYPHMVDRVGGKNMPVPQSTLIPAIFAYNDRVAQPWFAPLGFARGTYKGNTIKPVTWVKKNDRDKLVSGKVNPASNVNGQLVLLGNETLQIRETVLKKINVRRLLITAKKFISAVSWRYIGESNTSETRAELRAIINNYLQTVQDSRGLQRFSVSFPASMNPESSTVIRGKILLQPTLATEAVEITMGVTDTGTEFGD